MADLERALSRWEGEGGGPRPPAVNTGGRETASPRRNDGGADAPSSPLRALQSETLLDHSR
jgi:hypothetical protein